MSVMAWPFLRQISEARNGTGAEAMSRDTADLAPKTAGASVSHSICPYCAVGCGQLVFHRDGKLVAIEGDPESPLSEGHLCPKGAASFELLTHAARMTRVKYRPPFATDWQDIDAEQALDMIADRVWTTRARDLEWDRTGADGKAQALRQCRTIAHLGGATLDNEENYLIKKLFAGGLGLVSISNQARI